MRLLRFIAVSAVVCVAATADQVTLNNADRLTGKIVTADEKTVVIKTAYAGEVKLDRTMVSHIQSDETLNVTVKGAGTVKAKVDESATAANLTRADGTSMTVTPDAVTAIRDDAAQKAFERETERQTSPRLNDFWVGSIAFALANASGNSKTTSIATAASLTRAAGKNKIILNFAQLYSTQSTTAPFGQTANKVSGSFRVDRDITRKIFVYGLNAYDYDKFQNLDLRVVLGGGLGYHVWKTERGYFDVTAGGDWNRESFGAFDTTPAIVRNSGELTVGEEASYALYSKLNLFERFALLPNLTSTGDYRMVFDSTAGVPILRSLQWTLGFSDRYLSNPPDAIRKNDTLLTMGIKLTFDQTKR